MQITNTTERKRVEKDLRTINQSFNVLFDRAPFMMHSIDRGGRLVKVNRCWLQTLGYAKGEVLGRKSVEFLTEESRDHAVNDTLPLFWRAGSARSIGYQFLKKDGQILDVLLDAEAYPVDKVNSFSYAALRDSYELVQWEQASVTLKALLELTRRRDELEAVLYAKGSDNPDVAAVQPVSENMSEASWTKEALVALLEHMQDISIALRGLTRLHEESLDAVVEQQSELLGVAKQLNKTLLYLADTLAEDRPPSE